MLTLLEPREFVFIAEFETNTTRVQLDEQGIMHVFFKADEDVVMEDILVMHEWKSQQLKGGRHFNVTTPEYGSTVDSAVREWGRSDERTVSIGADALVVRTLAHKLLVNFYMKNNKPEHPTKVFSDEQSAVEWLLELKSAAED